MPFFLAAKSVCKEISEMIVIVPNLFPTDLIVFNSEILHSYRDVFFLIWWEYFPDRGHRIALVNTVSTILPQTHTFPQLLTAQVSSLPPLPSAPVEFYFPDAGRVCPWVQEHDLLMCMC